jgi:2-methylisocitrate lyase-like PEP mutase family enzyme
VRALRLRPPSLLAPKPLKVVMFRPGLDVAALADLGVRRISVAGALARVAWAAAITTVEEILGGSFEGLGKGKTSKQLNEMFS